MGSWRLTAICILWLVLALAFTRCSKESGPQANPVAKFNPDTITFAHSVKGWELYSWPNGNDWNYSILLGTNRIKSYQEVTTNKIVVAGKDSLKMLLDKFPAGEYLFWAGKGWLGNSWSGQYGTLGLPDNSVVSEIRDYCLQKKLVLNIGN